MGIKSRREREREELRQSILDASEELILQEGFEKLSMRKIADKIEYSTTTIYNYYHNKAEIICHLMRNIIEQIIAEFDRVFEQEFTSPVERLRTIIKIYIQYGLDNPTHYKMFFITDVTEFKDYMTDFPGLEPFKRLVKVVEECIDAGSFYSEEAAVISQGIWSAVHGITSLLIVRPDFPWEEKDKLLDHIIQTLIRGLLKHP